MRITTVGSGTGAPSPTRVCAAHVVEAGDARILLDCGSGAVFRMANIGIDWMALTHVALTHFHADHISDLPTLLYAWRYGALPPRSAPLQIIGPAGTADLMARLDAAFGGGMLQLGYEVTILELESSIPLELAPGVTLNHMSVPHTAESVAYSIVAGARRLVYTGDTPMHPPLAEWAAGCDLLLMECSLPRELAVPTHLTPEECGMMAALARPRALALTHFYPPLEHVDVAALVRVNYEGPIHLVHDGWTTELED
jgi:ribonuclease BN (tRNA processing enzyme)